MVSLPFRKKQAVRLDDEKAGAAYEQDQTRYSEKRSRIPSPRELAEGSFAPHPTFLRVIRFLSECAMILLKTSADSTEQCTELHLSRRSQRQLLG